MLIFLYGSDTFRSREQLKKMVTKFQAERDPQKLNTTILDCEKTPPDQIWEQIFLSPFLAEKRMVVLENLLNSKQPQLLEEFLDKMKNQKFPETTVIIVWESNSEFKNKSAQNLFKELAKEKFAQEFTPLQGAKLKTWLTQKITSENGKIEPPTLSYLVDNCPDLWQLHTLLETLIAYKNAEKITISDINLFIEEKVDDNIFNLVDAIIDKQSRKVYSQIQEQYHQGKDALYILAMISRQIKILLQLRGEFEKNDLIKSDELAKKLNLHPFVVKKSLPLVKRYTLDDLKQIYQQLLELDTKIKTGQGEPELLLDIFVARLAIKN